jgi:MurNAc alpha-1-phosphate uridylyltransferase
MILAAGRGERMRPLTDHTPKSMLTVDGTPLIFRHLEKLASAGFGRVVINHAYLGDQIESAVGDGSRWRIQIRFSREEQALETAGGIRNALALLREKVFAVVNADIYSQYDYARLADAIRQMRAGTLAHLVLVDNPPHHPRGDFSLQGNLVRAGVNELLTFSGMGTYRAALFDPVPAGGKYPLAPLLLEQITLGKVTGEHFRGVWDDIGTPSRLADLEARLQHTPGH